MARWRTSAAYRVAFVYSAAFALAILALGIAVYFAADADFRRQQDAAIVEESAELARDYRSEGLAEIQIDISRRDERRNAFTYALFERTGERIGGTLGVARPRLGWGSLRVPSTEDEPDALRSLTTALPGGRTLVVAADAEALERIDRTILVLFLIGFLSVAVIGMAGTLLLGGYLQRRLQGVLGTARAIVDGDLDRRVPVGIRDDEFDRLGTVINAMLERIVQLMENLRQVSGDVAHDLRTPLARLRAELEIALERPEDLAAQRNALKKALSQSDALLSLFAALLRISEVEGGDVRSDFAAVDLADLVSDLCETYQPAVVDAGRVLSCEAKGSTCVLGNRELLAQVVVNLLDNAQHHTPVGTSIMLGVERGPDWIRLSVADDGPGVAPADRSRIVHRFVRLEPSRTRPGHGLGLNLVAAIASAHGGALTIADNRPGLRAIVTLPRLP